MECLIVQVHASFIDFKVGVSLGHGFVLWCTVFKAKNNVWSDPAGSALTLVSHWSHNVRTTNYHLRTNGERNGVQRRTKAIFGKTMMWVLELLQLAKKHILARSDVEQQGNKACSYSHYRVMLFCRHQSVRPYVRQSVSQQKNLLNRKFFKFHGNLMQQKTSLGLTMPNQCFQTVRKQIFSWFWVDNFGPKSLNLYGPYSYIVLLYYMMMQETFGGIGFLCYCFNVHIPI